MWVIPTFKRVESLHRLLCSIDACVTRPEEVWAGALVIKYDPVLDEDTHNYLISADAPPMVWDCRLWPSPNVGCALALQWAFHSWPTEDCYGFLGDDTEVVSPGFFKRLQDAAGRWRIAVPNDLNYAAAPGQAMPPLPRHCCIGGALVRDWGFWTPPGLYHGLCDVFWLDVMRNCPRSWTLCLDAVLRHYHHLDAASFPPAHRTPNRFPQDPTHELGQRFIDFDRKVLASWMVDHGRDIIERLSAYNNTTRWEE